MRTKLPVPIAVKRALKKLGRDIRDARRRRRIPVKLMAERVGVTRVTLKAMEDGIPTVSMGTYATALYVLGLMERMRDAADIANDPVGQTISSSELPKRIYLKK